MNAIAADADATSVPGQQDRLRSYELLAQAAERAEGTPARAAVS